MGQQIPIAYCVECGERERLLEEERERAEAERRALELAGATPRLLAASLDATAPDLAAAADACRAWLDRHRDLPRDGGPRNLWITGPVGTGKTWLAWGIVRELALDAVAAHFAADEEFRGDRPTSPAFFVCWRDLLADLREQIRDPDGWATEVYNRACRVPVLALDDLGAERPTPWALESLAGLVQARYDQRKPTIITSNYRSDELAGRLGHEDETEGRRIVTRLVEDAVGINLDDRADRRRAA